MKRELRRVETGLAIIGAGLAGFAASIFALRRGLDTAQLGHTGAIAYTTGYFDLLGVMDGRVLDEPWAGLDALREAEPAHPFARLGNDEIREAFEIFTDAISDMGIAYSKPGDHNLSALLPSGVAKPTLSVPATMLPGVEAFRTGAKTLIVDFPGLQGFSATEFKVNFAASWPALSVCRIEFPGFEGQQLYPEVLARSLEAPHGREPLAEKIRAVLDGAEYVGLPAVLGMHAPDEVHADMERRIGARLFEIPTIPPAVPGIRLREMFERELPRRGLVLVPQLKVSRSELGADGAVHHLQGPLEDLEISARATLLATGRFLSGGLYADQAGLRETLLGLPVVQPSGRDNWYRRDYLDPRGHQLNRAGLETDAQFRPLDAAGAPVNPRLFAAGAVLAHQDWVRQRCGAGLAIAAAYGAVKAAAEMLNGSA
ncbi:MAG: anaerobic glycerol-3-phosphate dehydrogenase subunit B [Hyphomicrobiales bacterium]|nr:MAG: anaerobic glycerol-3-phosphate dehydrogenase subunit B [Hyphomicrobiales bacterium]